MDSEDRIKAHFRLAAGDPASADDLVLSRLRRDAAAARRRRLLALVGGGGLAAAAAVVVAVLLFSGGDDDRVRVVPPAQTSTTPSTSTTTTAVSVPTLPAKLSALDWDDTRFDLGIAKSVERAEQGTWRLTFDRVSLDGEEAHEFDAEPIIVGNTDVATENTNTRLRAYRVAANAEVLEIANLRDACSGNDVREEPRWARRSLEQTADRKLYEGYDQIALTFNADGFVTRVRLAKGC